MRHLMLLLLHAVDAYIPWNLDEDYFTETTAGGDLAGSQDGPLLNSSLSMPDAVAIDSVQQQLYVADRGNHRIRVVNLDLDTADAGYVTTVAGTTQGYLDGPATSARFNEPSGLAIDGHNHLLFISDAANNVVRQLDLASGQVSTLAGAYGVRGFQNGRGASALFMKPAGLALALNTRQLFVCDPFNNAVRTVNVVSKEVRTLAGTGTDGLADGTGATASFHEPQSVAVNEDETAVYVVDLTPRVRRLVMAVEPAYPEPTSGAASDNGYSSAVSTVLNAADVAGIEEIGGVSQAYEWPDGSLMLSDAKTDKVFRLSLLDDPEPAARRELAVNNGSTANDGRTLTACPHGASTSADASCHPRLRLLAGSTPGMLDGMGVRTRFYRPRGVSIDHTKQRVYVADSYNHRVRAILLTDVPDEVVEEKEEWYQWFARALRQNLVFILVLVGSTLGFCCCTYAICLQCSFCPVYQRRFHEKTLRTMAIGSRA